MWQANRALGYGLSGAIAVRDVLAAYGRFVASPFARRDNVVVMTVVVVRRGCGRGPQPIAGRSF
jgi:hypothetical protein